MKNVSETLVLAMCAVIVAASSLNAQQEEIFTFGSAENPSSNQIPNDPFFTLSGNLDLRLVPGSFQGASSESETALVRCWICTDMSCGETNGYGPALHITEVVGLDMVSIPFTTYFEAWSEYDSRAPNPLDFHSYYCNLRLTAERFGDVVSVMSSLSSEPSFTIPLLEPSYTIPLSDAESLWAKALNGSVLVTELSGSIN